VPMAWSSAPPRTAAMALPSSSLLMDRSLMWKWVMSVLALKKWRVGGGTSEGANQAEAAQHEERIEVGGAVVVGRRLREGVVGLDAGRAGEAGSVADVRRNDHVLDVRLARAGSLVVGAAVHCAHGLAIEFD